MTGEDDIVMRWGLARLVIQVSIDSSKDEENLKGRK